MQDFELFIFGLIALAWIVFQVIRRALKPPRPLGTIAEEQPVEEQPPPVPAFPAPVRDAPLDTQWGRLPAPPPVAIPAPVASEPFQWSVDAAQAELATAREVARRQARARLARAEVGQRKRHPHRPRLYTPDDLRDAIVMSAVIGPCRAIEPWQPPQQPR